MWNLLLGNVILNDAPTPWGVYFQNSATPSAEGIMELHDNIMFYLVMILIAVAWMLGSVIMNYNHTNSSIVHKYANHGTLMELMWTISPAFILLAMAFPSFKLLYLIDEVIDPSMTIKATGHQWYWSYEMADFINDDDENMEFDSYPIPTDDLEDGQLSLLDTDNRLVVPVDTHISYMVTGADVIHDFAIPSLGVKLDAIPGRLNQTSALIQSEGVYYGQCSELCGVLHSAMPMCMEAVPLEKFMSWLNDQA